jgi:hypothetical protein
LDNGEEGLKALDGSHEGHFSKVFLY